MFENKVGICSCKDKANAEYYQIDNVEDNYSGVVGFENSRQKSSALINFMLLSP